MKIIYKITKWSLYALFILVACIGIGLSGGVPLPKLGKRDQEKEKTELLEQQDNQEDCNQELM